MNKPKPKQAILTLLENDISVTMGLSVIDILYNNWDSKEILALTSKIDQFTALQSDFFTSNTKKYQKTMMFFHGYLLLTAINFKNKTL